MNHDDNQGSGTKSESSCPIAQTRDLLPYLHVSTNNNCNSIQGGLELKESMDDNSDVNIGIAYLLHNTIAQIAYQDTKNLQIRSGSN